MIKRTSFLRVCGLSAAFLAVAPAAWAGWTGWSEVPPGGVQTDVALNAVLLNDTLFLFRKGIDRKIYEKRARADGTFWRDWSEVNGDGVTNAALASAADNVSLQLFGKGIVDGGVYVNRFYNGSWSGWGPVLGGFKTDVAPAAARFGSRTYLFAKALNSREFVKVTNGWQWTEWSEVRGEGQTDVPLAAAALGTRLYLFGKGVNDKAIYVNSTDGTQWTGWQPMRDGATTDVALGAVTVGARLYLFRKSIGDNAVHMNIYNGSTWTGWSPVPGRQTDAPIAAARVYSAQRGSGVTIFIKELDSRIYVNTLWP